MVDNSVFQQGPRSDNSGVYQKGNPGYKTVVLTQEQYDQKQLKDKTNDNREISRRYLYERVIPSFASSYPHLFNEDYLGSPKGLLFSINLTNAWTKHIDIATDEKILRTSRGVRMSEANKEKKSDWPAKEKRAVDSYWEPACDRVRQIGDRGLPFVEEAQSGRIQAKLAGIWLLDKYDQEIPDRGNVGDAMRVSGFREERKLTDSAWFLLITKYLNDDQQLEVYELYGELRELEKTG